MTKIHTSSLYRIAYSTDASAYREVPMGVAFSKSEDDVVSLINEAKKRKTHIIPRAGGTSIAGQVVGSGIVADVSRYMNNILEINAAERWALVQPGVVLDELNLACKPYGLFFSPETSTSNRCCIGGMFGNNSCGSHSLIYGSTRHHVLAAKVVLADGSVETFESTTIAQLEKRFGTEFWTKKDSDRSLVENIYVQLIGYAVDERTWTLIEDSFPDKSLRRRSCGYAIDEAIEDLNNTTKVWRDREVDVCKLLCGSEGTLAFATAIKVSLDPLPPKEAMVVCAHCDTVEKSFVANLVALRHKGVTAIELMDYNILELSKANVEQQKNRFFIDGNPAAVLIVELKADTREELDTMAERVEYDLLNDDRGLVYACTRVYGSEISKVWSLRKAGLGLLSGMKGDAKPIGVIEDTAVAPERLPDYMKEFGVMLERLGLSCVYHAHISTGELHLRPIINIKTEEGKHLFRQVAEETACLVKKHRGSLSGEHGDGRLRGEFIPLMYGNEVYELMRDVKRVWDAESIFNVGKIVDAPPMDSNLRFEVKPEYAFEKVLKNDKTYFNWKAAFDECDVKGATGAKSQLHALMCSIEQCNGAGDCRKSNLIGGTLCPAYKVSRDETHTTRARANVLREVLTRGWESEAFDGAIKVNKALWDIEEIDEVLNSCLSCKGCRSECPSNVDMTRLKAEILQQRYDSKGIPFRSFMVSRMVQVERFGRMVIPLYNFFATWRPSATIIKRILRFAIERDIPKLSRHTMRQLVAREQRNCGVGGKERVVNLFADEFTNFQEAELGLSFARLLMALGYVVRIPKHVESGRAAISKGCLKYAKRCAEKNVELLSDVVTSDAPLVGIEPSCLLSFRDEYPDLVDSKMRDRAKGLAKNVYLFDEFIVREMEAGRITADMFEDGAVEIWLHGHCHQKSLVGIDKTVQMLGLLRGAKVNVIPSGCCGMAGSFGYEAEHYKTSLAIGEMVLFPTVRRVVMATSGVVPTIVAAPGTSCRQQIKDGTGVVAVHPIEILAKYIKK